MWVSIAFSNKILKKNVDHFVQVLTVPFIPKIIYFQYNKQLFYYVSKTLKGRK